MKELIKKLEAADGPSRELDTEILSSVFKIMQPKTPTGQSLSISDVLNAPRTPLFTGSIDAAMMVIPDGWEWDIKFGMHTDRNIFIVEMGEHIEIEHPEPLQECAPCLPIAICIAALHARERESAKD